MAASQFIIYSSSDPNGPGLITGTTGSLITVLDACLVNGYSGKPSAGWTKPIGNYSASLTGPSVLGCYHQPSGSGLTLFINDAGGNATSNGKESWATGWETITSLTSSNTANMTGSVGAGFGQFPIPAQLLATGHVVMRKSVTADATGRYWQLFADSNTFYLFVSTGDTAGVYYPFVFGDIFSLKGNTDGYRCAISGRWLENSAGNVTIADGGMDALCIPNGTCPLLWTIGSTAVTNTARFMARTAGGAGTSILITMVADLTVCILSGANNAGYTPLSGNIQTPNCTDNSFYLSPLRVSEISAGIIRGRFRGLYQLCHPIASFSDGQTFQGAGDFAGKSFQVVLKGPNNGMWAVETSNTVETN